MENLTTAKAYWFRFTRLILRSAMVLAISFLLYTPLLFGKTLYFADNIALMIPVRLAAKELLNAGAFPFWTHDITSGMPLHLEPAVALWYPPTWLFFVGSAQSIPLTLNLFFFLHLVIGGVGLWYFAKKLGRLSLFSCLVVVLCWIGSSYLVSVANNFTLLASASWIPWILYSLYSFAVRPSRFTAGLMVVSIALGWLGAHPQPWILGITAAIGLFLVRVFAYSPASKMIKSYLPLGFLAVVFTIALLAINLFPMLEYTSRSTRTVLSTQDLIQGSLNPLLLVHWIMPNWYSNPDIGLIWGPEWNKIKQTHGFVGVAGLFLFFHGAWVFIRSKNRDLSFAHDSLAVRYLALLAILGVVVSMGSYIPFLGEIYRYIPLIGALRNPSASLVLWAILTPVVIGFGVHHLGVYKHKYAGLLSWIGRPIFGVGLLLYLLHLASATWLPHVTQWLVSVEILPRAFFTTERFSAILLNSMMSGSFLLVSIGFICSSFRFKSTRLIAILFLVIFLELLVGNRPIQFYTNIEIYTQKSPQADWLKSHLKPGYRYLSGSDVLPYTGFTSYFHDVVTFPPFSTGTRFTEVEQERFYELRQRMNNLSSNWGAVYGLPTTYGYSTLILQDSARYWNQATRAEDQSFDRPWQSSINYLDHPRLGSQFLQQHGVRYYLVDNLIYDNREFQDQNLGLILVHTDNQNSFSVFEDPQAQSWIVGRVGNLEIHPNALSFTVFVESDMDPIVLYQTYDARWRCHSNTSFCEVKNYHGYQQIELPRGTHHLELSYKPVGWDWMVLFAGISGALFLYWWLSIGTLRRG